MRALQHPTANDVLGAPPGQTIEQCKALPVTRYVFQDEGVHACVSYWQPTAEELQRLNEGKPVRLCVLGRTHAPVCVDVDGDGWL